MPVALAARTTRKVPTAVFWAPAPSAMTSVAVAPEVETDESVPPEGTFVSVQGAVSDEAESVSEKVACTRSTLPFAVTSCMTSVPATRIGLAPSEGEVAAKEERLPAASRIPVAFVANATVKAADRGVGSARAFGDRERGDGGRDRDARRAFRRRGPFCERPRGGAGRVGRERLGEGGEHAVDLAVGVVVSHRERDEGRSHRVLRAHDRHRRRRVAEAARGRRRDRDRPVGEARGVDARERANSTTVDARRGRRDRRRPRRSDTRSTVSLASDVVGNVTSKSRLDWFVVVDERVAGADSVRERDRDGRVGGARRGSRS